jgi:hypothetical protein
LITVSRATLPQKVAAKFVLELDEAITEQCRKLCALSIDLNRIIEFVPALAAV